MLHRSVLVCLGGALTALGLLLVVASCSDDAFPASPAPPSEAGSETGLIGSDPTPGVPDADVPPGDVCGRSGGLMPGAQWPLAGGCVTRAGRSAQPGPTLAQISWTAPRRASTAPAVDEASVVWLGTADGDVVAIEGGVVRWAYHTGGVVASSPAIDALGHAIVASTDGLLYALAPEDAPADQDGGASAPDDAGAHAPPPRRVFAIDVGTSVSSPVIDGDGAIYVGTATGKLVRVRKDGSAIDWSVATGDTVGGSPALGQDGTIYVGSSDHKLYAVTDGGAVKWSLDLGSPVSGSPAVGGDGTVYVGTREGKLHAVASSGAERWWYATDAAITSMPAVYAGTVYVGSEDEALHAVSTASGAPRWKYPTFGAVATPLIDGEGTVFFGSTDLHVYAVSPKGSLLYAVNVKSPVRTAPALGAGPALYVAADDALVVISP
jgi:outer membrane protein assembly factor BamB